VQAWAKRNLKLTKLTEIKSSKQILGPIISILQSRVCCHTVNVDKNERHPVCDDAAWRLLHGGVASIANNEAQQGECKI